MHGESPGESPAQAPSRLLPVELWAALTLPAECWTVHTVYYIRALVPRVFWGLGQVDVVGHLCG